MHRNIVKIQIYCSINLRGILAKLLIYSYKSWKSDITGIVKNNSSNDHFLKVYQANYRKNKIELKKVRFLIPIPSTREGCFPHNNVMCYKVSYKCPA